MLKLLKRVDFTKNRDPIVDAGDGATGSDQNRFQKRQAPAFW